MNIMPINSIASIESRIKIDSIVGNAQNTQKADKTEDNSKFSFSDILKQMVNDVNVTDAQTKTDAYNLAMGYTDLADLHNIEINAVKADLALRTVTSVRNKVMDAYNEIMRLTV